MDLVKEVYLLTKDFPKSEEFGLVSQMRRCAVSIPSNIAEGFARRHKAEFSRFLGMALGSGAELETQIELARSLKFCDLKNIERPEGLLVEIQKMLHKLRG